MSRAIVGTLAVVAALAHGIGVAAAQAVTVRGEDVADFKAVFATVESVDVVAARARIGGTVANLVVDEGSAVERGKVIARVEDPKLRIRIAAIDARIEALMAQRDFAKTVLDRARNLRETGAASQARLDEALMNLDVVERELAAMRAERNVILEQRSEGDVLAPKSGRVLKVPVTEGAVILPGESVAEIATESYVLRMSLPERHARFIREGDPVLVGPRGMEAKPAEATIVGKVRQVYPEIRQGRVVADVDVPGLGTFFVGERMRVFVGAGQRRTFVIPNECLFQRQGVSFVRLQGGTEAVVQPGQPAARGVEILSGLRDGDVILPIETAKTAVR